VAERNHLLLSGTQSNLPSHFEYNDSISFEPVPSDYAILHMHTIPPLGGDTLWASTYEVYDRLGEKYAEFLEGLTGSWNASMFQVAADKNGFKLYEGERGSPENSKPVLESRHPLVRTNPVTGWKSVYSWGPTSIDGLTEKETQNIKECLLSLVLENHDIQVRFRWGQGDLAIWDNRATLHAATYVLLINCRTNVQDLILTLLSMIVPGTEWFLSGKSRIWTPIRFLGGPPWLRMSRME